jgi:uncharacterized damage-inducible protein DinB
MKSKQFIELALTAEIKYFNESVINLGDEELMWQPSTEANNINWIIWHMSRVEDMWFNFFCQGIPEVWESQNWYEKFNLPTRDNGFEHTSEQVNNFPKLELHSILQYRSSVRSSTLSYLNSLTHNQFSYTPREKRPDMNVADVFVQIINELFQHIGHIYYIRGLFNSK